MKNLGLVGAGYWGKNLARNFHQLGSLHTICDTNDSHLATYRQQYPDVEMTKSYSQMLENPRITKVAIASPALLHYTMAKQALLAGKDVYVEKPLCLDIREGQELIELAENRGLVLMVGHLLQYHGCMKKLQNLVQNDVLGDLHYICANRLNLGPYRTEENALWNFAPHDVSMILSLCGHRLPEQVRCLGGAFLSKGVADTTMTSLRFSPTLRAHIYVSWLNPFKEQKLTVVGSKGMAVFDDTKPWGEKLLLYKEHVSWANPQLPLANQVVPEKVDPQQTEPLKEECSHFLDCCDKRNRPITDSEEGLRVLKVLHAAQLSMDEEGEAQVLNSDNHYQSQQALLQTSF